MPIKTGDSLMDPVAAIARGIRRVDGYGHADMKDFVLVAARLLDIERTPEMEKRIEAIADELFEDMGERWTTAPQMAAMIYARLTS